MNNERLDTFTVLEPPRGAFSVNTTGYNLNVSSQSCDCGLWQEHGYPCIHAVASFKKNGQSFEDLLAAVNAENTYEYNVQLFKNNFLTVCINKVVPDKSILPPQFKKRKAGRTKKKRYRKRSRFSSTNPSMMTTRCSRCGLVGHNIRTCVARRAGSGEEEEDVNLL